MTTSSSTLWRLPKSKSVPRVARLTTIKSWPWKARKWSRWRRTWQLFHTRWGTALSEYVKHHPPSHLSAHQYESFPDSSYSQLTLPRGATEQIVLRRPKQYLARVGQRGLERLDPKRDRWAQSLRGLRKLYHRTAQLCVGLDQSILLQTRGYLEAECSLVDAIWRKMAHGPNLIYVLQVSITL